MNRSLHLLHDFLAICRELWFNSAVISAAFTCEIVTQTESRLHTSQFTALGSTDVPLSLIEEGRLKTKLQVVWEITCRRLFWLKTTEDGSEGGVKGEDL